MQMIVHEWGFRYYSDSAKKDARNILKEVIQQHESHQVLSFSTPFMQASSLDVHTQLHETEYQSVTTVMKSTTR